MPCRMDCLLPSKVVVRPPVRPPVFIREICGRLQAFIVEGDTPLFVGRPILKALQVKTDFERDLCSVLGSEYTTALMGPGENSCSLTKAWTRIP